MQISAANLLMMLNDFRFCICICSSVECLWFRRAFEGRPGVFMFITFEKQHQIVLFTDRRVRVFRFATGKLTRTYDESIEAAGELQKGESETCKLDPIDFGRRMAVEKELAASLDAPRPNAIFDTSGNFSIYPPLLGIKVLIGGR